MSILDDLRQAREAYERRDWVAAYEALSGLEEVHLTPDDFVTLATAAYMASRFNDIVQALQRAYQEYLHRGDVPGAVRAAYWLNLTLWNHGEIAIGNGWLARAQRLLDDVDDDIVERGYVLERIAFGHILDGDFGAALAAFPAVTEYGRRFGDRDLTAIGLHAQGRLTVYTGRIADGLRLLDEAMVAVVAGEVSPIFAGIIYCSSIEVCQEICDFGRAGQWTHALSVWCSAQPGIVAYTGQCAIHRGQLMRVHGAYDDALRELDGAVRRYRESGGHPAMGQALYEQAEVLRIVGRYRDAERAYDEAYEHGHQGQPGRALFWLARGRREAAAAAARRMLVERRDPVHRSQVLSAAAEIMVEVGAVDAAAPLVDELHNAGRAFSCTALQAAGRHADALVALARGRPEDGLDAARRGAEAWARIPAPYEVARCRMLAGRAMLLLGDEASAAGELSAAQEVFVSLGATPAQRAVADLLGVAPAPAGLSPREVEVLRLVATGRSNPEIAADLVLSEKTVARHLSNIFAKLDVTSRTAAAAFAFEHDLAG